MQKYISNFIRMHSFSALSKAIYCIYRKFQLSDIFFFFFFSKHNYIIAQLFIRAQALKGRVPYCLP